MENNYEVGYSKPPKGSQFKPGQSGNSKGRPKGAKNTIELLDDILNQKITVVENGKELILTKKAAMILQFITKAIKGDIRAIGTLMPILLQHDITEAERQKISKVFSEEDKLIFDDFLRSTIKDIQK